MLVAGASGCRCTAIRSRPRRRSATARCSSSAGAATGSSARSRGCAHSRPLDRARRARYARAARGRAAYLDATRAGARIGDIVAAGAAAYARARLRRRRVARAPPGRPDRVHDARLPRRIPAPDSYADDRRPFAWNPSGGGFKVEDTVARRRRATWRSSARTPTGPCSTVAGRAAPGRARLNLKSARHVALSGAQRERRDRRRQRRAGRRRRAGGGDRGRGSGT